MTRSSLRMTVVVALAWLASPSAADAQYEYQCEDASQCPAGTACVNGTCAQQQQQEAAPQPQEGQAQQGQAQQGQAQQGQAQQGQAQQEQLPPPPQQQPPPPQQQQAYPQQQQYPQQQYPQQQYGAQPYPQQQQQYGNPLYAQPQQQAPAEGRHLVGLIIGGVVIWAVSYATNAFVSAFAGAFTVCSGGGACPDESEWGEFRGFGFVPLIGPWMQLAAKPTPFSQDSWGGWLIGDAILQTAGLTMLILGATIEVGGRSYGEGPGDGVELAIVPQIGPTQNGLQLVGTF